MKFTKRLTAMVLFVTTTVAISAQNVYVYKSGHFALQQQVESATRISSTTNGGTRGIVVKNSSEQDQAFVANTDFDYILFREANPKRQKVTVGSAQWASFAPSFSVNPKFTETGNDTKLYYVTDRDDETCVLTLVDVNSTLGTEKALGEGVGILLYSENPTEVTFTHSTAETGSLANNKLEGTTQLTDHPGGDDLYYILNKKGDQVKFYRWLKGQLAANKSYLHLPAGSSAPEFFNFGDYETLIQSVHDAIDYKLQDTEIYNLSGQRINRTQRGVNIVNGRKVLR